ncbi:MAG: hypothetical protein KGI33_08890 [Thaumarchaeota archaeon]|nr:hypothetical protein [Nitrososphaerota archaeon]
MRIDLCRLCGSERIPYVFCSECREPTAFFCRNCDRVGAITHVHLQQKAESD